MEKLPTYKPNFQHFSPDQHIYIWDNPSIDWSTHAQRTVYITRDQAAPTFDSATVDGDELTITFNEDLGDAANLANSAFTVKKTPSGGTETTVTLDSTAPPEIDKDKVTLYLASAVVATDSDIKVSYAKPDTGSDNKLVDKFGNEAASFTDEEVDRPNVPHTGTPTIAAPNVFRVPAELYVDFSTITDGNGTENIRDQATYTWKRYSADGMTEEAANIGTEATYTLTADDVGKTIRADVTFQDDHGHTETPDTIPATAVITAAATCAAPTLTGGVVQIWNGKLGVGKTTAMLAGSEFVRHGYSAIIGDESFGSLDMTDFTVVNSYTWGGLFIRTTDGAIGALEFHFPTPTNLTETERAQLSLFVCSDRLDFSKAETPSIGSGYAWSDHGLDWSTHAQRTIYITRDQVAPTFESATVNGTSLVITFNEDLGAAANLANSAFTVKKTVSGESEDDG